VTNLPDVIYIKIFVINKLLILYMIEVILILIFIIFVITYIIMINNLDLSISDSNQLTYNINNLNIIGIMVGILISVIDINTVNKLQLNDKILLMIQLSKLIIYMTLIGVAGTSYSDYNNIVVKNNSGLKWSIAIKPLVPFLCGISIQSLILTINLINKLIKSPDKIHSSDEYISFEDT